MCDRPPSPTITRPLLPSLTLATYHTHLSHLPTPYHTLSHLVTGGRLSSTSLGELLGQRLEWIDTPSFIVKQARHLPKDLRKSPHISTTFANLL